MGSFGRQVQDTTGRPVQVSADGKPEWKHGGVTIDWDKIGDVAAETELADGSKVAAGDKYLRYGQVLGQVTASGKYAPAVIGALAVAYDGGTTLTVPTQAARDILARFGASGTNEFKLRGTPSGGGSVRTLEISHSAIDVATGAITVTAEDVAVQSQVTVIDFGGTPDGGSFRVGINGEWTAEQAYNVSTADLQTALEGLASLSSGDVTVSGSAGDTYTLTFGGNLAGVAVTVELDSEVTDGGSEVGVEQSNSQAASAAVDGSFAAGSLILPSDGAEEMTRGETFIVNQSAIKSELGSDHLPVFEGGLVYSARIKNWGTVLEGLILDSFPRLRLVRETN